MSSIRVTPAEVEAARHRPRRLVILALWTVALWANRIRNIAGDDDLEGEAVVRPLTVALGFTLLGVLVLYGIWRQRRWRWPVAALLVVLTVVYWPIRMLLIALADHSAGFIAVHAVLAAVSVVLAWRCLPRPLRRVAEVRAPR